MKKNITLLSFFSLILICGIFYPMIKFFSKDKAKDLEILAVEKAKSAIKVIIPSFNKALENSDDINLLMNIESVAKIKNITVCFILNKEGKVIIHNNTSEWNTERNSEIYNKAIKKRTEFLQQTSDKNILLFSQPLINNCTLFCMFSIQKAKETAKYWEIKYYTVFSFSALIIAIILHFLSKLFILIPFNKTKKALEHKSVEDIKKGKYNEIADIFVIEREKTARKIELLEGDRENLTDIIEYLQKDFSKDSLAFIILNSLNKVVYARDNTGNILKKNNTERDRHILEISENSNFINIVTKANENPGKEITESFENYVITALSINACNTSNKIVGTIVTTKLKN